MNNSKEIFIFRSSILTKDGQKIFAKDYGKRAFRIPISINKAKK